MDSELVSKCRALLEQMLAELDDEAVDTVTGMRDESSLYPDPNDRATLESSRNLTLRIRDRERKLRRKVNEALERIEEGTFGYCEVCEEEISPARLVARPVTTLCIRCKSEQEEDEVKHHA